MNADKNILNQVLTGPEAAAEWGLAESTVRNTAAVGKFEPHEARRAGKNWLITRDGMQRVFGKAKSLKYRTNRILEEVNLNDLRK